MAALTQSAIDALLGQLTKAVQDEAQLIGGVHRDMKFIKDEMDSMNGFLMHLNKMESEHDDQVRAWMKQVREIAYVAEDCVERYGRDMDRSGISRGGCAAYAAMALLALRKPKTFWELHQLGKQITELRARVHEVGERRMRYDVKVPDGRDRRLVWNEAASGQEEERRERFVRTLEEEVQEDERRASAQAQAQAPDPLGRPSLVLRARAKMGGLLALPLRLGGGGGDTVAQLPGLVVSSEAATVRGILKRCCPPPPPDRPTLTDAEADEFRCTKKMFLCALYVYPYPTNAELKQLKEGVEAPGVAAQEARHQVMVFCYSMLSTQQKSCLQYLTAFLHETEISRTSMVRRWVAEGLVGKEPGGGRSTATPQEAGERCFRELLLRGFIRAARWGDAGTVKSCVMDGPVKDFVDGITRSENFLSDLPAHLQRQLEIRSIVRYGRPSMSAPAPAPLRSVLLSSCCGGGVTRSRYDDEQDYASSAATLNLKQHPMDALVDFVKELPKLYRLNVLDLGGCKGLRRRHIEAFTELDCLRYLSLRNTDVPGLLPARHMNRLKLLETLDIRGTSIPPRDTKRIYLPKLKHLLAGRFTTTTTASAEKEALVTVDVPDRIGLMRGMETLSRVRVSVDGAELQGVAKLQQLRKLGVVVHANAATAAVLGRVLYMLAGSLRSLSVWVVDAVAVARTRTTTQTQTQQGKGGGEGILDISSMHEIAPRPSLALENLHIKGKMSLPSWLGRAPRLANITLRDTEMNGGDALRRLAAVVSLCCLKLSRKAFTEQALRFKDVQFQALRFLVVEGDGAFTRVAFFAGDAAPKLERIVWSIGGGSTTARAQKNEELIVGIQHLPSLKRIELRASFKVNNLLDWTQQQRRRQTTSPKYRIYYVSSSTDRRNEIIDQVQKAATDTTLTLPAGVIDQLT